MRNLLRSLTLVAFLGVGTAFATIDSNLQALLGNPSGATIDPSNHSHFLIQRAQYWMDYNDTTREPNWVSWNLTTGDVGSSGRSNFDVDPGLPAGFTQVQTTAYSGSGYDRGHMCPSADRTVSVADNKIVFYMTNMIPQAPDNNQGVWASFETYCRSLAALNNEILIISGPSGFAGSTIASGVGIPGYTWKIAVVVPVGPGPATSRIDASTRVIAIKIPNIAGIRNNPWQQYITTAAQLENDTGYTFFTTLETTLAATLRSKLDGQPANGSPVITQQPVPQSTFLGGGATFTVAATGDAPLTYQWQKDDLPIAGATTTTLTIAGAVAGDAGVYNVVVTNGVGSTTSADATLTLTNVPPSILASPATQSVPAGSTVTLAVSASGSPTLQYQWRRNTVPIGGATAASLVLPNVQSPGSEGTYDVVVTNGSGQAFSDPATVTVTPAAPTIVTQPANRSTVTGGTASFSVVATGTEPLTYQWYKGATILTNGGSISGANSATLVLTGVVPGDAGTYSVLVGNAHGDAPSNPAALTIRPAVAYLGGTYTQNFDTLPSTGTFTFTGPGPFNLDAAQPNGVGASGLAGWSIGRTGTANMLFAVGTGSGTAGSAYSFGALNSADRALGTLLSGSISPFFGLVLINNTSFTITQFTVSFTGEQWRYGGTTAGQDRLQFEYQVAGSDIATGTFTPVSALEFRSVTSIAPTGARDGNATSAAINGTVNVTWAPGQTLVLRWRDLDISGSDDGLAIDNFTFSTPVVLPTAPQVASTSPAAGATSVGVSSPITVTFNQPVTVGPAWFSITSASAGPIAATVTGGPTAFTLTPPVNFPTNDVISVRVHQGQVIEQATGTLALAANHDFSFATAASTTPTPPVIEPPLPVAQTVNAGTTVTFSVVASGTAPMTFQWRKAGFPITTNASALTPNLVLPGVSAADVGSYDCLVTNVAGNASSPPVALTVLFPPSITTPPVAQTAVPGGSATFSVIATGTATLTYQWRRNSVALADGPNVTGAQSPTLTLSNLAANDSASIDVVVTNTVTSVSSTPVALTLIPGQIAYTGGTYLQTFDTLPATGTFTFSGAGPHPVPSTSPASVLGWGFAKISGSGANALFVLGNGAGNQGAAYSFGATAASDRALGTLLSGTTGSTIGAVLVNNTGGTLATATITYRGEQWRYGGTTGGPDKLLCEYQVGGTGILTGTFTAAAALDFAAPVFSGGAGLQDGNVKSAVVTTSLTGLNWAPGQTLVIRWRDLDVSGADDGLAIDNFSFSASPPTPPVVASVSPVNGTTGVGASALLAVTFDQPVLATGAWITVTGAVSGPIPATISGGPSTFTITPVGGLPYFDTITATVLASQIKDLSGSVNLAANHSFSFSTALPPPPTITQPPLPQVLAAGDGTTLSVTAGGFGALTYQWRKDGNPIPGATNPSLVFGVVTPADGGSYDVLVGNLGGFTPSGSATLTVNRTTVLVRRAPVINSGIDGSIQVLTAENISLGGVAWISRDLFVPGTPAVVLTGTPVYAGTVDATGAVSPSAYTVTLGGTSVLRHVVRRADPIPMPTVAAPPAPAGTRIVTLSNPSQNAGDFSTLRNLTLAGTAGLVAIPPGTYGNFSATGSSGFVLGVPNATTPAVYNFQSLSINALPGNAQLQVVGPVIVTVNGTSLVNGPAGSGAHPEWLVYRIAAGGLTVSGNVTFHGSVVAPNGTVTLNVNATLNGTVASDRLTVNGTSVVNDPTF